MTATMLVVVVGAAIALVVAVRSGLGASSGWVSLLAGIWTYQVVVASEQVSWGLRRLDHRVAWLPLALLLVLFLSWTVTRWRRDRRAPWGTLVGGTLTVGVWLWIVSAGRHTDLPALWAVYVLGTLYLTVLAATAARELWNGSATVLHGHVTDESGRPRP